MPAHRHHLRRHPARHVGPAWHRSVDPAADALDLGREGRRPARGRRRGGAERPALVGSSEGGSICILFAARYPERVSSLPLRDAPRRFSQELPDFPWGFSPSEIEAQIDEIDRDWGEGALAESVLRTGRQDTGRSETCSASCNGRSPVRPWPNRGGGHSWTSTCGASSLRCTRPPWCSPGQATTSYPSKRRRPSPPHYRTHGSNGYLPVHTAASTFSTSSAKPCCSSSATSPSQPADERVLKTVMFTDIVGSTERLSAQRRFALAPPAGQSRQSRRPHRLDLWRSPCQPHRGWHIRASSMHLPGPCGARSTCCPPSARGIFPSGSAFTPANASGAVTSGAGSRCIRAHGSVRWPARVRSWPAGRCATCPQARG